MSKGIYIVNCYTCQHNGQETCKGCNTLLNGDVEPYENWELREDLSQKDQRIAELEQELAKYKDLQDRLGLENVDELEWFVMLDLLTDNEKNMHILDLHRELAELKEKDNYHLRYELAGADETIANLKQQLEEKDKEIEQYKSNQKVISLHSAEDWYNRFIDTTTQNIKLELNQKQLAIQELEKVKNFIDGRTYCADYINKRIQELKGE